MLLHETFLIVFFIETSTHISIYFTECLILISCDRKRCRFACDYFITAVLANLIRFIIWKLLETIIETRYPIDIVFKEREKFASVLF